MQFNRNLSQLKNLKTLVCQRIVFDFRLEDFKSFTKLEIWPTEPQLAMAKRIQQERRLLNRKDLELIVSGFRVSGSRVSGSKEELVSCKLSSSNFSMVLELTQAYLELVKSNGSKFSGCAPWKTKLQLATLVRHADGKISNEFFVHFPKLHTISHGELFQLGEPFQLENTEASHLIELLKRSNTTRLQLFSMNLTQEFYDQLTCVDEEIGNRDSRKF